MSVVGGEGSEKIGCDDAFSQHHICDVPFCAFSLFFKCLFFNSGIEKSSSILSNCFPLF